jgi:hypothetical protein
MTKDRELLEAFAKYWNESDGPQNPEEYGYIILPSDIDFFLATLPEEINTDFSDAEDFLNSKDIWNHPRISDRNDKQSYDVAQLMSEFANMQVALPEEKEEKRITPFCSNCEKWNGYDRGAGRKQLSGRCGLADHHKSTYADDSCTYFQPINPNNQ